MFGYLSTREIEELFFNPFLILGCIAAVTLIHHRYQRVGPMGILVGGLIGSALGRVGSSIDGYYQGAFVIGLFYSWLLAT